MSVRLIAHVFVTVDDEVLIIQRSAIKRGKDNVYPRFWDIPGGSVEEGELPRDAAIRECAEEIGLVLNEPNLTIIHEDSQFDHDKQTVFTRLVYHYHLTEKPAVIRLDPEEHTDFFWLKKEEVQTKKLVPYLERILEKRKP
ncbi:NUDIX hydrolase [Streptococcus entericus]|uniref:NUDIX hydrolase n=1 Tax=Streptococcus entericus TaxID=155680 RepID=UPI00037D8450|nr:NUDIX hydrolase [Streptococcus entericus]